ncbi:MAG: serine/threonine-protein kinase [Kofleriaceae bacterium]
MKDDEEAAGSSASSDPDFPGRAIAGYVLDGEIGRGGMGIVYAATHPLIGKRVAIKILSRELGSDRVALERFLLEARSVNAIGHPNIVDTFDFGILHDGRQYLVMDLLIGETLRTRLRRGRLMIEEASIILDEVASALAAAHSKGIIHRDLKPDNVFVVVVPGRAPEIKLLDFGLVKLTTTSSDGVERTRSGAIVGTPNYMSPEQARAKGRLDHRTDIYALGVLAFEMISGELPYIRDNALDTLIAHVQDEIPTLHEMIDHVPIELAQLVEAMMAKAPDDRPTIAAVRQVLRRMPRGEISTTVDLHPPKPIAPQHPTFSDRPQRATSRPSLALPPELEHVSSPSIPGALARSSPFLAAFADDEDQTVVAVPPPPRPRAHRPARSPRHHAAAGPAVDARRAAAGRRWRRTDRIVGDPRAARTATRRPAHRARACRRSSPAPPHLLPRCPSRPTRRAAASRCRPRHRSPLLQSWPPCRG